MQAKIDFLARGHEFDHEFGSQVDLAPVVLSSTTFEVTLCPSASLS